MSYSPEVLAEWALLVTDAAAFLTPDLSLVQLVSHKDNSVASCVELFVQIDSASPETRLTPEHIALLIEFRESMACLIAVIRAILRMVASTFASNHLAPDKINADFECSICLVGHNESHIIGIPGCGHQFHSSCLWKNIGYRRPTCPLCRRDVPLEWDWADAMTVSAPQHLVNDLEGLCQSLSGIMPQDN